MFWYKVFGLLLITACVVSQTAGPLATTIRWNQFCDESLDSCQNTYNKIPSELVRAADVHQFKSCVKSVWCERWSQGYYRQMDLVSLANQILEYYDPGDWFVNGASDPRGQRSSPLMFILLLPSVVLTRLLLNMLH